MANKLWEDARLEFPSHLYEELMIDIEHPVECVQEAAAKALATLVEEDKNEIQSILQTLLSLYKNRLEVGILNKDYFIVLIWYSSLEFYYNVQHVIII